MAISVRFEGHNSIMRPPKPLIGQPVDTPIYTYKDGNGVVSCWLLTEAELREVIATGAVWLAIRGNDMPQAKVSGSALVNVGDRASGGRASRPVELGRKIN